MKNMKKYPSRTDPFSVTRDYDRASPVLFDYCCNSKPIASASLIKRKDIGGSMLRGYLRFDFDNLLITKVSWKNSDPMKETLTFVFRSVTVKYRTTKYQVGSDVAILQSLSDVSWSYKAAMLKAAGMG